MTSVPVPRVRSRRGLRDVPLWLRLVAAMLLLLGVALAVSGTIATRSLHGYLLDRVDQQLSAAARVDDRPDDGDGRGFGGVPCNGSGRGQLGGSYVVCSLADGTPITTVSTDSALPELPGLTAAYASAHAGGLFTVPSRDGGTSWRVVVRTGQVGVPGQAGQAGVYAAAIDLSDVEATVGRLTRILLVVAAVVLALLAVVTYVIVRRSLRPLVQVEHTAAAIADGDLSQRVPEGSPSTEVGRLSHALNGMLGQIETAFDAQRESETAARESEQRMRRFVADASHELRTPLTSIRGFAELYRQGAVREPEDLSRVMRRVEDEAARMGLLVDELLLLARLDQQRPLESAPVDLLDLATDAVTDAQVVDREHPTTLELLGDQQPLVLGDNARLRQVVGNLLSNARAHTPPGARVVVRVGVQQGAAVVEVADSGPGLPPDQAARVFERFYRADSARTRSSGGSGLGLSIVAALVHAHGGQVRLDTTPGQGATFRVELPLAGAPVPQPA